MSDSIQPFDPAFVVVNLLVVGIGAGDFDNRLPLADKPHGLGGVERLFVVIFGGSPPSSVDDLGTVQGDPNQAISSRREGEHTACPPTAAWANHPVATTEIDLLSVGSMRKCPAIP